MAFLVRVDRGRRVPDRDSVGAHLLHADLLTWGSAAAFASGVLAADFGSGLVHWAADTWGRDDLPVLGRRLLVPFRVHHVNPDDFLRRRFVDTNGDVAFIATPLVLALLSMRVADHMSMNILVSGFGFCSVGMLTNQIHQWAHMPDPPRVVRVLQDGGLILGRGQHAAHHQRPHNTCYCITTGWCNRPLEWIEFFARLERLVTGATGLRPREDDSRYVARYG